MNLLEEAICFAVKAHEGMTRKDGATPYILHPLEAAAICATMTRDQSIIAAAVLHDTIEDTAVTKEEIQAHFGDRVAELVASETEVEYPDLSPEISWPLRKEESLQRLQKTQDPSVKILWLSDKLSNLRSLYRQWLEQGPAMWTRYHQQDPASQAWYYSSIAQALSELKGTAAWQEYHVLLETIFEGVRENG